MVERELDNYPYTRKAKTVDPYFTPMDLMEADANENFEAAITDAGRRRQFRAAIQLTPEFAPQFAPEFTPEFIVMKKL